MQLCEYNALQVGDRLKHKERPGTFVVIGVAPHRADEKGIPQTMQVRREGDGALFKASSAYDWEREL